MTRAELLSKGPDAVWEEIKEATYNPRKRSRGDSPGVLMVYARALGVSLKDGPRHRTAKKLKEDIMAAMKKFLAEEEELTVCSDLHVTLMSEFDHLA